MKGFTEKLMTDIQHAILKQLKNTEYIQVSYEDRQPLPKGFIEKIWGQVDWDAILEEIKPKMHTRICSSMIGAMEAEIKTDVKKLMSVSGVREKLRMEVYPKLMAVLEGE